MNIKDINKGLVVYHDRFGLLVVDKVLDNGNVSCSDGHIVVDPLYLDNVDSNMLASRGITQDMLNKAKAHI